MSTALDIPQFLPTQFGTAWQHLNQQKLTRMRGTVDVDSDIVGERKSYNQFGIVDDEEITTRFGDTVDMGRQDFKRWISLKPYHRTDWYEEWDEQLLGNIALPKSETLESHRMAFGRRVDKVVIAALTDDATTGEDGTETTALPASQIVAVNYTGGTPANTNLTLEKLIKAKSILGKNEVTGFDSEDQKEIIFVYTQDQLDNLLENVDEIKNSDYTQVKALIAGEVSNFLGMRFVRTELLDVASDIRSCFAYVKSAIKLGVGQEMTTRMSIRNDKSDALQIRSKWRLGATRMLETEVVKVLCDETA